MCYIPIDLSLILRNLLRFKSSRCHLLYKTAPLVYNIHSEPNTLSSELFLSSPLSKKAFTNEADSVSLARDRASYNLIALITPDIPNQAKQAL